MGSRSIFICICLVAALFFPGLPHLQVHRFTIGAGVPEGYVTFADLAKAYPDRISLEGDAYIITADLDVPAAHPLYVGPGVIALFDPGVSLGLRGAPILAGSVSGPIVFGPSDGAAWDGITATGTGTSDILSVSNISISGASVGLRAIGAKLISSDVRVMDCTSTGVEIRQSMKDAPASLTRLTVDGCRFYGLSIWESPSVSLDDARIADSGTGIRAYMSTVIATDVRISNSTGNGIQLVDSSLFGEHLTLLTDRSAAFTTSSQISATNSTIEIAEGRIGFANRGVQSIKGSVVTLVRSDIGPLNQQGIFLESGSFAMSFGSVHDCAEGAVYSYGSSLSIDAVEFDRNGAGHSGTKASTVLSVNSTGLIEGSNFRSRQKADIECFGSIMTISNSSVLPGARSFILGDSSTITVGNSPPPSGIEYLDPFSRTRYLSYVKVEVIEHPGGAPHVGAVVDLRDRTGSTIASTSTGLDGVTPLIGYIVYTNNSLETRSRLPITIFASAPGRIVSSLVMTYPTSDVELVLYPPNDPPGLWIGSPSEGTLAGSSVEVSGKTWDDIGVEAISVRIDTSGPFLTPIEPDPSGAFTVQVPLQDIGSGRHRMELRAYDGAQFSGPSVVNITIMNPITTDSDSDGLTDRTEDRNGNGTVDPGETDPQDPDSDDDGLIDGIEDINGNGRLDTNETDPLDPDSDSDYLLDGIEDSNWNGRVDANETDPLDMDTDHDGIDDRDDRRPLEPGDVPSAERTATDTTLLVLSTIVFLLALTVVYLLYIRIGSGPRGVVRHHDHRRGRMEGGEKKA
jgi:hypothetical protein